VGSLALAQQAIDKTIGEEEVGEIMAVLPLDQSVSNS